MRVIAIVTNVCFHLASEFGWQALISWADLRVDNFAEMIRPIRFFTTLILDADESRTMCNTRRSYVSIYGIVCKVDPAGSRVIVATPASGRSFSSKGDKTRQGSPFYHTHQVLLVRSLID
jgi:hypothetical protein